MDTPEVEALLASMRRVKAEPTDVEVKSGAGGFPTSVRETVVAFANGEGGTIIVGVDEAAGFAVVGIPDSQSYRDAMIGVAREVVQPPLDVDVELIDVGGQILLIAEVAELPADQKPAYIKSKGVSTGAYVRIGDGDRRMTQTEIALTYSSRTQPLYDREAVSAASVDDLSKPAVSRTLERVRLGSASLRDADDETVMERLGISVRTGSGERVPTLGGLLVFGEYPQQHFPQLMVSVVVFPAGEALSERFVDSVSIRGSIPEMVSETLSALRRNLTARAVIVDGGREDRLDYPLEAIREAAVNALMHRDYSPTTRGTQVQIELHPDRLEFKSPGGLYGPITQEQLGEDGVSSSRNATIASLLSDTYLPRTQQLVAENRASGVPTMIARARDNGQPRPIFRSAPARFEVTMESSQLLGPATRRWLTRLGSPLPSTMHEIAMAMMLGDHVTNETLREWGADRVEAGQVLRDLVDRGLAVRTGGRRYAKYVLDPSAPTAGEADESEFDAQETGMSVERALRSVGEARASDLEALTGLSRGAVVNHLNALIHARRVEPVGAPRSPRRSYRWVHPSGSEADDV